MSQDNDCSQCEACVFFRNLFTFLQNEAVPVPIAIHALLQVAMTVAFECGYSKDEIEDEIKQAYQAAYELQQENNRRKQDD